MLPREVCAVFGWCEFQLSSWLDVILHENVLLAVSTRLCLSTSSSSAWSFPPSTATASHFPWCVPTSCRPPTSCVQRRSVLVTSVQHVSDHTNMHQASILNWVCESHTLWFIYGLLMCLWLSRVDVTLKDSLIFKYDDPSVKACEDHCMCVSCNFVSCSVGDKWSYTHLLVQKYTTVFA